MVLQAFPTGLPWPGLTSPHNDSVNQKGSGAAKPGMQGCMQGALLRMQSPMQNSSYLALKPCSALLAACL